MSFLFHLRHGRQILRVEVDGFRLNLIAHYLLSFLFVFLPYYYYWVSFGLVIKTVQPSNNKQNYYVIALIFIRITCFCRSTTHVPKFTQQKFINLNQTFRQILFKKCQYNYNFDSYNFQIKLFIIFYSFLIKGVLINLQHKNILSQQQQILNFRLILLKTLIKGMKLTSMLVRSFFKQLMKYPTKQYYSLPNTIQSSVGLIFKFPDNQNIQTIQEFDRKVLAEDSKFDNVQLLFVQRAGYHLDRNAYNVVFPGGQCDAKQSDISACQRQLTEQIGIQTKKQCIYLGQLPANFYYLKKKGKQVHISCHTYCIKSSQNKWQPKLNSDELRKFKWVRISELLKKDKYLTRKQLKLGIFERMAPFAAKIAKQNISNITMPELDLGMDRNLWGLTLWVWSYMLQMSLNNIGSKLKDVQITQLRGLIQFMKQFKIQYKPMSLYKIPTSVIASGWHYLYRVKPFTYNPPGFNKSTKLLRNAIILILFIAAINYYFALF